MAHQVNGEVAPTSAFLDVSLLPTLEIWRRMLLGSTRARS